MLSAARFLADGGVSGTGGTTLSTVDSVRARGGIVVATGGCFDVLHAGHVRMLQAAWALCDCLVVCLNSDASVRGLKGPERPVNGQADRDEQYKPADTAKLNPPERVAAAIMFALSQPAGCEVRELVVAHAEEPSWH